VPPPGASRARLLPVRDEGGGPARGGHEEEAGAPSLLPVREEESDEEENYFSIELTPSLFTFLAARIF
jgi:hypothetical protein